MDDLKLVLHNFSRKPGKAGIFRTGAKLRGKTTEKTGTVDLGQAVFQVIPQYRAVRMHNNIRDSAAVRGIARIGEYGHSDGMDMDSIIVLCSERPAQRSDDGRSFLTGRKRQAAADQFSMILPDQGFIMGVGAGIGCKEVHVQICPVYIPENIENKGLLTAAGDGFTKYFQNSHDLSSVHIFDFRVKAKPGSEGLSNHPEFFFLHALGIPQNPNTV